MTKQRMGVGNPRKVLIALCCTLCCGALWAEPAYSPFADAAYPTRVLWGDTHLHTTNSLDARLVGVEDAYRFARGEQVVASSGQQAPTFLVGALKDPFSGNLDRIQIIKGWLDADGKTHEKTFNVAWGDAPRRELQRDGRLPAVGNTVNLADASWTNTIGDAELVGFWQDPAFDAAQPSVYYARVLEIPTPRWTAYDAKHFGDEPPAGASMTIQERAYTSPIWYKP